jgi:copper chaperone CopZ
MSTIGTHTVTGMTCGHCVASVTQEIQKIGGVEGVSVDLPTGAVTITSAMPLDSSAVVGAVEAAGYQIGERP